MVTASARVTEILSAVLADSRGATDSAGILVGLCVRAVPVSGVGLALMTDEGPAAFQETVSRIDSEARPEGIATFLFDLLHIKLQPRLRHRNIFRPGIPPKTGPGRLRKRPQSKRLRSFQGFRVEIIAFFPLESDPERLFVKSSAHPGVAHNRSKSRDEQNSNISHRPPWKT